MKPLSFLLLSSALLLALGTVQETAGADAAPARGESVPPPGTYEIGGPLAGLKLPPFKYGAKYGPFPEVELYPGAAEHWRSYWMKYCPVRSYFDLQSQIKNWVAPNIPGADPARAENLSTPVWRAPAGQKTAPYPVIRWKAGRPVFRLDLGELPPSLYAIRVIAAVPSDQLRKFEWPVILRATINDGLHGETSTYRRRIPYTDEFYADAEIFFHAPEKRRYRAELTLEPGTRIDLLVHNITLDDVLAGSIRQPIKPRMTVTTPEEIDALKAEATEAERREISEHFQPPLTKEERLQRDENIWKYSFLPMNAMFETTGMGAAPQGADGLTAEQIKAKYGEWRGARADPGPRLPRGAEAPNGFLVNDHLKLEYTMDDLMAGKPLPAPYPYPDDGLGFLYPDPTNPAKGTVWEPVAMAVGFRIRSASNTRREATLWLKTGNRDIARDGAIRLIRYAYQFPAIRAKDGMRYVVMPDVDEKGRDGFRHQMDQHMEWANYGGYLDALADYDRLFDYLRGNQELADSVHRFVPWVTTPQDVIELLDVYLVQHTAKRILRYHDYTMPDAIAYVAATLADRSVTDPWMDWLFTRTFIYPMTPAGYDNLIISATDRNGPEYIGSTFYAGGEGARPTRSMELYLLNGGNPRYDLTDPQRYPKGRAHIQWLLDILIGGNEFARIGDVTGPEKFTGYRLRSIANSAHENWAFTHDPRFAWILKNLARRTTETDAQWAEVEKAAETVPRAPWLDNRSRVVFNWFGALETGLEHDDDRFRRAAYVRAGWGTGHSHADTLDLQVIAHGLPMTIEDGQRSGYTKPNSKFTRVHNTVDLEKGNSEYGLATFAWVPTLSDAPGARYLRAEVPPAGDRRVYQRQTAILDVDEGAGSVPLSVSNQMFGAKLPDGVTTPDSYVFDVFRVAGGGAHTYCFHGPVNDEFAWNAAGVKTPAGTEAAYLSDFSASRDSWFAGDAPSVLEATWRYSRDPQAGGNEQTQGGVNYDPQSPRKFTRLHLLDLPAARALRADIASLRYGYRITDVMVKPKDRGEHGFVGVIEPYVGEPFLTECRTLPIANNESDALRAVAVEVKTKNGHTDVCFADGRPDRVRQFQISNSQSLRALAGQIAAEFAYVSTDTNGLRQATLTGGTLLETPWIKIVPARREYTGTIARVDYLQKSLWIDPPWPAAAGGRVLDIGTPENRTCYTSTTVEPAKSGSRITVDLGADLYRAPVKSIDTNGTIHCDISLTPARAGLKNIAATNESRTKSWRVDHVGGGKFQVRGAPPVAGDFGADNVLRLWEYGVGDPVRQSTYVSVRRVEPALAGKPVEYEVQGDVDCEITIHGKTHPVTAVDLANNGGKVLLKIGK